MYAISLKQVETNKVEVGQAIYNWKIRNIDAGEQFIFMKLS